MIAFIRSTHSTVDIKIKQMMIVSSVGGSEGDGDGYHNLK